MRVGIDGVGRMVIPKRLREEVGITQATELELTVIDGRLEITMPDVRAHVEERDGVAVIVPDEPIQSMTADDTRDAIDRVRR